MCRCGWRWRLGVGMREREGREDLEMGGREHVSGDVAIA